MTATSPAGSVDHNETELGRFTTRPAVTKGPYGIGRVILALFILGFSCLVVLLVAGTAFAFVEKPSPPVQVLRMGIPLALWWLVAWVVGRTMFTMSWGDMISHRPGLRWGFFGRSVAVAALIFGAFWSFRIARADEPVVTSSAVLVAILLALVFISLQASAEELIFRGFGPQIVLGSTGFSTARFWIVSAGFSVAFALLHGASNAGTFVFYIAMALILTAIVWRTAGLEGSFALHLVFNITSFCSALLLGQNLDKESTPSMLELATLAGVSLVAALAIIALARRDAARRS